VATEDTDRASFYILHVSHTRPTRTGFSCVTHMTYTHWLPMCHTHDLHSLASHVSHTLPTLTGFSCVTYITYTHWLLMCHIQDLHSLASHVSHTRPTLTGYTVLIDWLIGSSTYISHMQSFVMFCFCHCGDVKSILLQLTGNTLDSLNAGIQLFETFCSSLSSLSSCYFLLKCACLVCFS